MNSWFPHIQDTHKPYQQWAVYEFESDKLFRCGHVKDEANTYIFMYQGYPCIRCLTCKRENWRKYGKVA